MSLSRPPDVRLNKDGQAVTRPTWDEDWEGWELANPTQSLIGVDEGNRLVIRQEVKLLPNIDLTAAQAEWDGFPAIGVLGEILDMNP